jgi:hypothetical protein
MSRGLHRYGHLPGTVKDDFQQEASQITNREVEER